MPSVLNSSVSAPLVVHDDDAAVAADLLERAVDHVVRRLGRGDAGEPHARADLVRDDRADEVFAAAGRGDRAGRVVRVGAGADDRRVADAAPALVRHAAGRGRGGEVAVPVARDGADRAEEADVLIGGGGDALGLLRLLRFLELLPAPLGVEVAAGHERHALFERELLRAFAREQHVRRALHDHARKLDRVLDVPHARDGAGFLRRAVHDGGVELVDAGVVEHRALAGVEERRVLQDLHRRDHGVEARAAFLEHGIAGVERALEVGAVGALVFGGHRGAADHAGAAVNGDRNHR